MSCGRRAWASRRTDDITMHRNRRAEASGGARGEKANFYAGSRAGWPTPGITGRFACRRFGRSDEGQAVWSGREDAACCAGNWQTGVSLRPFAWDRELRRQRPLSQAMGEARRLPSLPPFPPDYRASGLLLHVTSLPSRYGVGDVGPAALEWVDRLREAGQVWWQALPLGPTGYGDSPYQAQSSFAGNELLISPAWLIEDGLLRASEMESRAFSATAVDYDAVIPFKQRVLDTAWANFRAGVHSELRDGFATFCAEHAHWLEDYALFRPLKARYGGRHYLEWPSELVERVPATLAQVRRDLSGQIDQIRFAQFLLFRQGERLKARAHTNGVRLMGDLPFFVSPDSSDVWAKPELFLLDAHHRPRFVAGVPPDYFSADGQLWGNPVYDWDALRTTGYRWCIDRVRALLAHVDAIRLDHFRGFAAAWHVPAGASTARSGQWVPGPGATLFSALQKELGGLPFIAEDLGLITPDVHALRDQFHLPGTRVLQFAFDGHTDNPHLPDNYV